MGCLVETLRSHGVEVIDPIALELSKGVEEQSLAGESIQELIGKAKELMKK